MAKDWTPDGAAATLQLIYQRVLERDAEPAAFVTWGSNLDRGELSVREIVRSIGQSPEFYETHIKHVGEDDKRVDNLYHAFLARKPESAQAYEDWGNALENLPFDQVVHDMIATPEYLQRFGENRVPMP